MRLIQGFHSKLDITDYAYKSNSNFSYILKMNLILCQDEKAYELPQIMKIWDEYVYSLLQPQPRKSKKRTEYKDSTCLVFLKCLVNAASSTHSVK